MINYQKILNKNMINVLIEILQNIKKNGLKNGNHLYITFITDHPSVSIPDWLLKKYPEEMTIVIQYEYYNFSINKNNFKIGLSFNDIKVDLIIDYKSIISFVDPNSNFGLKLKNNEFKKTKNKKMQKTTKIKKQRSNNVIDFTNYKKI